MKVTDTRKIKMDSKQILEDLVNLLKEKDISIKTEFLGDESGNITHQVLVMEHGDYVSISKPKPLGTTLRHVTAKESNSTVQ